MCEIRRGLPCIPPAGSPEGEESQYSRAPVDAQLRKYSAMIKAELPHLLQRLCHTGTL